jgi:hypothetical protein
MFLTTDAVIVDAPKKEEHNHTPAGWMPDMWGIGMY